MSKLTCLTMLFWIKVNIVDGVQLNMYILSVTIYAQACNKKSCNPPQGLAITPLNLEPR